jgi:U4/U6.U5 tri-snRNP-associated protein 2
MNVYACLICGKYFQGRSENTHAYTHSLENQHHMFINLTNQKVYCLPDDYEVQSSKLDDIKYNIDPKYDQKEVDDLDMPGSKLFPYNMFN